MVETIVEANQRKVEHMQFGFMPGCGTTDVILYLWKKKKLHFAFADLEKAFEKIP